MPVRAPRFHQMFFVTPCSYRRRGDHAEAFKFIKIVLSAVVRCKTYRAPVARLAAAVAAAAAAVAPAGFVSCIAPTFFYNLQFPLYLSLMRNRLKSAEAHSRAFLFSHDNSRAVTSVTTGCSKRGSYLQITCQVKQATNIQTSVSVTSLRGRLQGCLVGTSHSLQTHYF